MTDNERRAHDLAIAIITVSTSPDALRGIAISNGKSELNIDYYKAYMGIYEMALQSFMRDFPDGN